MVFLRRLVHRMKAMVFSRRVADEFEDELAAHESHLATEYESKGMDRSSARVAARRDLGSSVKIREDHREAGRLPFLDSLWQDVSYAWRTLRRQPAYAAGVLLVIALGTGANTAVFSLARATIFRPAPFPQSESLVTVWEHDTIRGASERNPSPASYRDWLRLGGPFQELAASFGASPTLTGAGEPERLQGRTVSTNYFQTLGVSPALGRWFEPDDAGERQAVVLLSDAIWRRRFAQDPQVVGRTIVLDGLSHVVIGVMPDRVRALGEADVWLPITFGAEEWKLRDNFVTVIGRLKTGVTLEAARSEMQALAAHLRNESPEAYRGIATTLVPLESFSVRDARGTVLILLSAAGLLLAAACASVANLLLARAVSRHREMSIRRALGAAPGRLARQLGTEGLVLSILGTGLGALFGVAIIAVLSRFAPSTLVAWSDVRLDTAVLASTMGVSLFCALLFSFVPIQEVLRRSSEARLRASAGITASAGHQTARRIVTAAQVALSFTLLVLGALLGQTLWRLSAVDLGFQPENVLTMRLAPRRFQSVAQRAQFHDQLLSRVRSLPGVEQAALISFLPLTDPGGVVFTVEGRPETADPGRAPTARLWVVTPGYFETMGIPLVNGRTFESADRGESAPLVMVVNRTLANRFWSDAQATGHRIRRGPGAWSEIVGVVEDVRGSGLHRAFEPEIYIVDRQYQGFFFPRDLAVKTTGSPAALANAIKEAVWLLDRNIPISRIRPMQEVVDATVLPARFRAALVAAFAGVALLLAVAGIYGVVAYGVASRSREIGLRMALGAEPGTVTRAVLGESLLLVVPGILGGAAVTLAAAQILDGIVFGVRTNDPLTYAIAGLLILLMALAASWAPSRRAARLDPAVVLRVD